MIMLRPTMNRFDDIRNKILLNTDNSLFDLYEYINSLHDYIDELESNAYRSS